VPYIPKAKGQAIQSVLMALIVALLLWFGRQFLELKLQATRIEADTVYMRGNQSDMKQSISKLDERVRHLEITSYVKAP
jgi:hypothetical protein